jgi:hypothetical protein
VLYAWLIVQPIVGWVAAKARFEARLRRRAAAACNDINDRHSLASPTPLGHMNATEMWPSG